MTGNTIIIANFVFLLISTWGWLRLWLYIRFRSGLWGPVFEIALDGFGSRWAMMFLIIFPVVSGLFSVASILAAKKFHNKVLLSYLAVLSALLIYSNLAAVLE